MKRADIVWKYGPLGFGIPVSVITGLYHWLESHGWQIENMASLKFLLLVTIWLMVGYIVGAVGGWIFVVTWRFTFGDAPE